MPELRIEGSGPDWVRIVASISPAVEGGALIKSSHYSMAGELRCVFESIRPEDFYSTEYGVGLSVVHDAKDHYLHGLGITPLSEFQTIVQTYYSRELAGGTSNLAVGQNYVQRICTALSEEFYGPRQPRVYADDARGFLIEYGTELSIEAKAHLLLHMHRICFDIILPALSTLYRLYPVLLQYQKSTLDQAELIEKLLPNLSWSSREHRLLHPIDNIGFQTEVFVFVHEGARAATRLISEEIKRYIASFNIARSLGPVFSTEGYCV